jgi:hypothetical protein
MKSYFDHAATHLPLPSHISHSGHLTGRGAFSACVSGSARMECTTRRRLLLLKDVKAATCNDRIDRRIQDKDRIVLFDKEDCKQ